MMRRKIVSIVICTAVFMAIPSVSAFALDGWQQDAAQEWIYKENDKKLENFYKCACENDEKGI